MEQKSNDQEMFHVFMRITLYVKKKKILTRNSNYPYNYF